MLSLFIWWSFTFFKFGHPNDVRRSTPLTLTPQPQAGIIIGVGVGTEVGSRPLPTFTFLCRGPATDIQNICNSNIKQESQAGSIACLADFISCSRPLNLLGILSGTLERGVQWGQLPPKIYDRGGIALP